jgi:uncharacterized peroxidase-related enzyme
MAWVQTISEEEAKGDLAIIYEKARQRAGVVPNIARLQSLRPHTLNRSFDLYCQLMDDPSGLTKRERVLIATIVSKTNGCYY